MVFDPSELINGRRNRRHNLNMVDGKASMAYFGELPWHTLGTRLDHPATSLEAIAAANLNYEVRVVEMITSDPMFGGLAIPFGRAVVREDTRQVLGNVGPTWKPVQNREAFNFLDAIAAEDKIEYHTCGALGNGERIWLLAKLPGVIRVAQTDDEVEKYLLLSNAHDGSSALRVLWTPQRVVCQNTLAIALRDEEAGIKIRHSGDINQKVREAQRVLGLAERFFDDIQPRIDRLAQFKPSSKELKGYFNALYPDPENTEKGAGKKAAEQASNIRTYLEDLFESGIGHDMPGIKGSMWAAYNAVTEYIDHDRPVKIKDGLSSDIGKSKTLESIWWGTGAQVKRSAWNLATELAECC